LKVDVPVVRKSVDRARDALKTLTAVATIADAEKLLDAQDACEHAISWIAMVEERCKGEQLHLDIKQEPREVDFVPFRPGNGISIYEFFQRFEDWSRGQMSQDDKANVLYNRHLHPSIKEGNKELEDAKRNYLAMKSLLVEKWGTCDLVCDQYLEGIERVAMPNDPKDKVGMLNYVKNAYNRLTTLTKLEVTRGQPVPGLEEYYLSNQFLKRVHRVLPEELGSQFLMKLQENGESYYLMKGRQYMDRMISLLRCCYKSLEIALEDYPPQQNAPVAATTRPRPAQLPNAKDGSMSVNLFDMGMCPALCAEPPTGSVPCLPSKRRRRRKRRSRIGAFVGIEEQVAKLEQELKQVRLQVACQELRIAELEIKTIRTKGKDRAAKILAQSPPAPASTDEADPARRTVTRRKETGPASGDDGSEPGVLDQESQARAPRPDQVKRRQRSRKRRRKSRSSQVSGPANSDPRSLLTDQTGNESKKSVPGPECTTLAIQGSSTGVPSAAAVQGLTVDASVGSVARARKYAVLYAQKTPLNRTPRVAGVDPMALLQFAVVIEMWKTRLIPVLIWTMQHLKN
jgi:hypothetical protein